MSKRNWTIGILVVLAILGGIFFLYAPAQRLADGDTEQPTAPEFDSDAVPAVAIENARLVLPAEAGRPAAVYFDVHNRGDRNQVIREVSVEHSQRVGIYDTEVAEVRRIDNVSVAAGATVRFAPDARQLVAVDYDSNVVPGAIVEVTVTLADGETVSAPATVEAGMGQGGAPAANTEAGTS